MDMEGVSQRSHKLMKPALPYISTLFKAFPDLWSPSNPEGWIPLVVAENKLGNEAVLQRLEAVKDYPTWVMNYSGAKGIPQLQEALARLMEHTFVKGVTLDPQQIVIAAGCSAILDHLFYIICDEGEGVLIPAPYYPAFDNDLRAKAHLHPLPFYMQEGPDAPSIPAQLDAAVAEAAGRGIPVRALLVTNPNNPLGTVYSQDSVRVMVGWCLQHKIHYVSDEIYAKSIFKPSDFASALTVAQQFAQPSFANSNGSSSSGTEAAPSTAAAAVAEGAGAAVGGGGGVGPAAGAADVGANGSNGLGSSNGGLNDRRAGLYSQQHIDTYVHLIYGLSKDWCASGLRVGVLYSRNLPLQQALESVAFFSGISNYQQHALAEVLGDLPWVDAFLSNNCKLLERSYDTVAGALREAGIPFLPAVGGMFVWVDLRQWLPAATWEGERQLWESVCERSKVILTPGESCHAREPGFFRLCFAWVEPEALGVAVQRMASQFGGPAAAAAAK